MKVISSYTYPAESIFRTGAHNKNIFSVTRGEGVVSEVNGRLNETNLYSNFKARRFHVFPDHMTQGETQFMLTPMEIFDEAFQETAGNGFENDDASYLMIPGTSLRWYQNRPGVFIAQISMFFSPFRIVIRKKAGSNLQSMGVRMFVDGEAIPQTTRALPVSVELLNTGTRKLHVFERRRGDFMDITWSGEVAAGWHDIHLGLFIERPRRLINEFHTEIGFSYTAEARLHQRLYVGIRNARVMTFTNA
jgi:hypothetical protein